MRGMVRERRILVLGQGEGLVLRAEGWGVNINVQIYRHIDIYIYDI